MTSMSAQPTDIEKRSYPRVHLFRPIKLTHYDGTEIKANLRDLSPNGLQAVCGQDATNGLMRKFSPEDESAQSHITACFNLPIDGEFFDITIECKFVHLSVVPDEGVTIGLDFVHCRQPDLDRLKRFILCSLEPA